MAHIYTETVCELYHQIEAHSLKSRTNNQYRTALPSPPDSLPPSICLPPSPHSSVRLSVPLFRLFAHSCNSSLSSTLSLVRSLSISQSFTDRCASACMSVCLFVLCLCVTLFDLICLSLPISVFPAYLDPSCPLSPSYSSHPFPTLGFFLSLNL